MARWSTALETAAIYVGAIVGAGFASGREIYVFFVRHGPAGVYAALAAGALLGIAAAALLPAAIRSGSRDYADLCRILAGRGSQALAWLLSFFLFGGLAVMIAAGATVISLNTPLGHTNAVAAVAALTALAVAFGARGLAIVNRWLVPYLSLAVLGVAIFSIRAAEPMVSVAPAPTQTASLFWSLALYVGYNFITGFAVLVSLPNANPRQRTAGSAFGGLVLGGLLAIAAAALTDSRANIAATPMPLLTLASSLGPGWATAYAIAIAAAILTTAVADAYALARRIPALPSWLAGTVLVALAVPLANQGFTKLVDTGYPLLGAVGVTVLGLAFWRMLRPKPKR